jgi:hypothetical protein
LICVMSGACGLACRRPKRSNVSRPALMRLDPSRPIEYAADEDAVYRRVFHAETDWKFRGDGAYTARRPQQSHSIGQQINCKDHEAAHEGALPDGWHRK